MILSLDLGLPKNEDNPKCSAKIHLFSKKTLYLHQILYNNTKNNSSHETHLLTNPSDNQSIVCFFSKCTDSGDFHTNNLP